MGTFSRPAESPRAYLTGVQVGQRERCEGQMGVCVLPRGSPNR